MTSASVTFCYGKDLDLFLICAKRNVPSSCLPLPSLYPFFFLQVRTAVLCLATSGRTGSISFPVETHEEGQEGGSSVGRGLKHGRSPHTSPRWLPQGRAQRGEELVEKTFPAEARGKPSGRAVWVHPYLPKSSSQSSPTTGILFCPSPTSC